MDAFKRTLKDSAAIRWLVLVIISMFMFGTYWFQDFMSGLKGLMESELGISSNQFGLIISSTTWANMFGMIIVGGIILDKWGIRVAGVVFGIVASVGASITAMASYGVFGEESATIMKYMMAGRMLFGIGLESICVIVTRTTVKWFKGYELALAMAINVAFGRFGTAFGTAFSVEIGGGHVAPAVVFAASLIGLGFILFLAYLIFDIRLDKQVNAMKQEGETEEEFKFNDLLKLVTNKGFIYITLLCVAFYSAVFPFIQYAPDLLVNKFGFTYQLPDMSSLNLMEKITAIFHNGPKVTGLIPLGTILFTPIFGSVVDKKGKAASLMILGAFLLIFAHVSLSLFNSVALGYLGLVALGIAFALVPAAMWPSVAKIVAESRLGTAYSTMFTIQNWGLGAFFWGIGAVLDYVNKADLPAIQAGEKVYNYTVPVLMLVVCGIVSIFLAYMLLRVDKQNKYGLELPSGETAV